MQGDSCFEVLIVTSQSYRKAGREDHRACNTFAAVKEGVAMHSSFAV